MGRILPLAAVALFLLAFFALSAPVPRTASAAPDLPPRPTLTPTPENLTRILLVGGSIYEGGWTIVQWQDKQGDWHDVEGWQGHVRNGWIRWRVAPKDWGTGPFRWLVYDQPDGTLLAATTSFTLPRGTYGLLELVPMPVTSPTSSSGSSTPGNSTAGNSTAGNSTMTD